MEPRIQYARTEDGVSIAYWTMGSGLAFVQMPVPPLSHVQLELKVPLWRAWDERLAENRTHVRYDHRGTGLSDRNVTEVSLQTLLLDLEAVVDRLALEKFVLFGHHGTCAGAITYAVRYPQRVSHLILWCPFPRTGRGQQQLISGALGALLSEDWDTYTETIAHTVFGWSEGEEAHRFAGLMREFSTPEIFEAYFDVEFDVADVLASVSCPTLVVQRRGYELVPIEVAQEICSRIPDAQLALLEGTTGVTYMEDMEALALTIDEFLGDAKPGKVAAEGDTHAILFTDMEGSTTLADRLGDTVAQEVRRTHNEIVRAALSANGGSEIKHTGDGIMASFSTASSALECAIAIQRGVAAHKEQHPDSPLGVYVGLNAGEPIAEDDDLFGTSINLAARICDHAQPGQILAADVVRQLAAGKQFLFSDLGETALRGFEDPVKLWELMWE